MFSSKYGKCQSGSISATPSAEMNSVEMTFAIAVVPSGQVVSTGRPARHPDLIGRRPTDSGVATSDIIRYHCWEARMTDMLIRDVPDDVIAALEAHARRLGLSRTEYVRRRLAQDAVVYGSPVSTGDLTRFAETFGDLADPDVMSQAWQ